MTRGSKSGQSSNRNQLAAARALKAQQTPSVEDVLAQAQSELAKTCEKLQIEIEQSSKLSHVVQQEKEHSAQLSTALDAERSRVAELSSALDTERALSVQLSSALDAEIVHSKELYKKIRVEKRARQRGQQRKVLLEKKIQELKAADLGRYDELKKVTSNASKTIDALLKLEQENSSLHHELLKALERCVTETSEAQEKRAEMSDKLKASRTVTRKLEKQCRQAKAVKERAVQRMKEKIQKERSVHSLFHKGTYTQDTRDLIRLLVQAGCSKEHVGGVICAVLKVARISVKDVVSRRTVSRVIDEGYIAAQIQLGYEMENAKSMTFSGDGTTHRATQFNARHVNYKVETNASDGSKITEHTTRLLGVHSALDGSSEQSVQTWKDILAGITDIYNQSPLKQREGGLFRVVDIFFKLAGVHSDHCAKEKKDAKLLEKEKASAMYQSLGEDVITESSNQDLQPAYLEARRAMIESVGGLKKWNGLSASAQAEKEAGMLEHLVVKLGKDKFEELDKDEQRILKLFIWAGCGCHKDLNTVRGGNLAMMAWWDANNIPGPVLLANKDNKAVLKSHKSESDEVDFAQDRALNVTSRGGVKATKLAGDIFNNKDDKKGYHDDFRWWWTKNVRENFTFPDTSNTRFQSYCEAAACLLLHLEQFIKFLEYIRDKKSNKQFSNMEQNLWNALHCTPTRTELAVLALYAQAVTHPYMKVVRAPGTERVNMLDLGPLHDKVYKHIMRIAQDPNFLIGPAVTFEMGAMDGKQWERPDVLHAIWALAPTLPYLKPVLVAFFEEAGKTWKRFTSEFAPGGLIDEATIEEKDLAWMPPTNDANEGALGAFRVLMRRQPQLSLLQYNAQAMFKKNKTQKFMQDKFQAEDHQFIRQMARSLDSHGEEAKRKRMLVEHNEARIQKRKAVSEKRKNDAADKAERIAAIPLIFDKEEIVKLRGQKLKDHLLAFQQAGAPHLGGITVRSTVQQIRVALQKAVESFHDGVWVPKGVELDSGSDWEE
jgi:hypothetical protein